MEKQYEISAEVMDRIETICAIGNTKEEKECVKRYLLEIITDVRSVVDFDYHDIYTTFWGGGKVTAFEVAASADDEQRMHHLVEQIRQKCAQIAPFSKMILYLMCCENCMLKMDEVNELNDWFSTLDSNLDIRWGFSKNCEDNLRAIVLVQK